MDLRQKRGALRYDGRFGKFVNFSAIKIPRGTDIVPRGIFILRIKGFRSEEHALFKALFIGGKSLFVTQTAH